MCPQCIALRALLRKSKQFYPNVDFPHLSKGKRPVTLKMSYLNDSMTVKDSEQRVKGKPAHCVTGTAILEDGFLKNGFRAQCEAMRSTQGVQLIGQ